MTKQGVRTTVTLDPDVAARLADEVRRTARPLRKVLNDRIRLGFSSNIQVIPPEPFKVRAFPLGLKPGLSYDCVEKLLEELEGPAHR